MKKRYTLNQNNGIQVSIEELYQLFISCLNWSWSFFLFFLFKIPCLVLVKIYNLKCFNTKWNSVKYTRKVELVQHLSQFCSQFSLRMINDLNCAHENHLFHTKHLILTVMGTFWSFNHHHKEISRTPYRSNR